MIHRISVVSAPGVSTYIVGCQANGGIVAEIKIHPIRFNGDPFQHYCGFDENGKLLFSIEPSAPCDVEYV